MEKVNFKLVCPECQIMRVPRSRHCYICGECVTRFDHHCEWINTCVGGYNNVIFLAFIVALLLNMLITIVLCVFEIVILFNGEKGPSVYTSDIKLFPDWWYNQTVTLIVLSVLTVIYSVFLIPLGALLLVQIGNYCKGLTTNERFGRDALQTEEESHLFDDTVMDGVEQTDMNITLGSN